MCLYQLLYIGFDVNLVLHLHYVPNYFTFCFFITYIPYFISYFQLINHHHYHALTVTEESERDLSPLAVFDDPQQNFLAESDGDTRTAF